MKAEERFVQSKGDLRQLREQGKVPGVVYGKKISKPTAIAVNEKELLSVLRSHPNAVLEMEIPSAGKQPVMMTAVQRDPLTRHLLHIDFHQINMNEEVKTQVRLDVIGESAGVKEGGVLQVMLHELDIHCLPNRIPESIEVDISGLQVGENVLVSDLKLPEGVQSGIEGEMVVVTVLAPQKDITEEAAEAAAEGETPTASGADEVKES
jgi:large subunit ribosomal protein L25